MIADILPAGAVAAESFGPPGARNLLPAEAAVVVTADPARRAEFAAGRAVGSSRPGHRRQALTATPRWCGSPCSAAPGSG